MAAIQNIGIIGMGALGIMFGQQLNKTYGKKHVTFYADAERVEKYRENEILCNGEICDFSIQVPPTKADERKSEDLLIFAVKATALSDAIDEAKYLVDGHTILLSLLNGISSEEALGDAFGTKNLLYCVAQGMDATKLGYSLNYSHIGQLRVGYPKGEDKSEILKELTAVLHWAGIPYAIEDDILHRIWSKWMLNVGCNQVVMVSGGTYRTVQEPGKYRDMMIGAMEEVRALAEKEGVALTEDDIQGYLDLMATLNPDGAPSMRQDGIEKRKSEVEFFAGTVIKKAKKYELPVPINCELYRRVLEIESTY